MLIIFWEPGSVTFVDSLQKEAKNTGVYYVNLISKLRDAIKEKVRKSCAKMFCWIRIMHLIVRPPLQHSQ